VNGAAALAAEDGGAEWRLGAAAHRRLAAAVVRAATPNGLSTRRSPHPSARDLLNQGPVFDTFRTERALDVPCPAPENWLVDAVRLGEARRWAAPSLGLVRKTSGASHVGESN